MNALQSFIQSHLYLTGKTLPGLITLDRLCPVLVRCGGCRFTCAAQDVAHLISCIEAGKDYVRDISFPVGSIERAADWQPEGHGLVSHVPDRDAKARHAHNLKLNQFPGQQFNESQCGGVFDGFQVTSDADPGL